MASELVRRADVLISLIPQTDMAIWASSLRNTPWVSYIRGLPWPDRGEKQRFVRALRKRTELFVLRNARDVWATTPTLASSVYPDIVPRLIPAGIAALPRTHFGGENEGKNPLIWAGRLVPEKRPDLFAELVNTIEHEGIMYGDGAGREKLEKDRTKFFRLVGWAPKADIFANASVYVGTSTREAFGRSAAEAAMQGIPVVLTENYGVAPYLYTDRYLAERFVVPPDDLDAMSSSVQLLMDDDEMRSRVSQHVFENASRLTIEASLDEIVNALENPPASSKSEVSCPRL